MKLRNEYDLLSLPANRIPDGLSNSKSRSLTFYSESLLDESIFTELVTLLNNNKLSQIEILNKLKQCNSES